MIEELRRFHMRGLMLGIGLLGLLLLAACSSSEETVGSPAGDEDVPTVKVKFFFSLSGHIAGKSQKASTRMPSDVVQKDGSVDAFRGIDDVRMLCYDSYPQQTSTKIGKMIEMKSTDPDVVEDVTEQDYSEYREISIPVGTSHFGFYARAADSPRNHEEYMKYGVIETIGLSPGSYQGNSGIRFRPVQICKSADDLGGSATGQRLLDLLNELMNITGPETAPNDKWATVNNLYLNEAYKRMKELKTLSSFHVQTMLAAVNRIINQEPPDDQGKLLAAAITEKIASCCTEAPTPTSETINLKEDYQGFPDDIHLPAGAARISWDETQGRFVIPDVQAYGKELNVMSMNDYCYPMNLQYQVLSNIVASEKTVLFTDETGDGTPNPTPTTNDNTQDESNSVAQNWQKLIDSLYVGASSRVQTNTQSVAMVQQVNYAVGRLALRTRISTDNIYDAKGKLVNVSKGFTLKGYIVGGQREVDYNFQPVPGSREYAIYDNGLNGGPQAVKCHEFTDTTFILGLGTAAEKNIYLALELVNNGDDFQGADGVIVHGATFYLVADLAPSEGSNYSTSLNQIFMRDRATQVNLTINGGWRDKDGDGVPDPDLDEHDNPKPLTGLATATYGLPNLDIPHPTVGISVNLSWEEGLWYDEIIL